MYCEMITTLSLVNITTSYNAMMNMVVQIYLQHSDFIFFDYTLRSQVLGRVLVLFLTFEEPVYYFPE